MLAHHLEMHCQRSIHLSLAVPSVWKALQKPWLMWNHRAAKPIR